MLTIVNSMGKEARYMNAKDENKIILYQDDNGITKVSVRFAEEDLWLTQKQIAEIIEGIYKDEELQSEATH